MKMKTGKSYTKSKNTHILRSNIPVTDISKLGKCIVVDGAYSYQNDVMEYRGYILPEKKLIFALQPTKGASCNIAEFLAIVHAIGYQKRENLSLPIYSDSKIAINWVKQKTHRSKEIKTDYVQDLMERAIKFLHHTGITHEIRWWNKYLLGENIADYQRK